MLLPISNLHFPLFLLFIFHNSLPSLGANNKSDNNNNQQQQFEDFVARQKFPSKSSLSSSSTDNSNSIISPQLLSVSDVSEFRANCSVPMCQGKLAPIFCSGPLINSAWYFGVQQKCPGSRLRHDANLVVANFHGIIRNNTLSKEDFLIFCQENFDNEPYLRAANLHDWQPKPPMFGTIFDPKMRKFALALHKIWPSLAREFVDDVHRSQDHYPVLSVPNRFVVPGGFFNVYFYWDTYWILKGLYFCNLTETANGILQNFAHVLRLHGFIPNSGNVQLSRRSQPPLFTQMISDYYAVTGDKTFLAKFLVYAEQELEWWHQNRTVEFGWKERRENGRQQQPGRHLMFQYKTVTDCPRPENLMEDYQLGIQTGRPRFFWSSTASACESGLDFSSRWYKWGTEIGKERKQSAEMKRKREEENKEEEGEKEEAYDDVGIDAADRMAIATNDVLPVDLNVFMAMNYGTMARLYAEMGGDEAQRKVEHFRALAQQLSQSIDQIFFDADKGAWFDMDLVQRKRRTKFYPSNIYPLLVEGNAEKRCNAVLAYLNKSGALGFKGGIPSSLDRASTQQWDFPNGWAPQQHLFVASLLQCKKNKGANQIGQQIADSFLTTTFNGFFHPEPGKPAQMWEKYDVRFDNGNSGFGGEYPSQVGFGWTNGVVLEFIRMFYTTTRSAEDNNDASKTDAKLLQHGRGERETPFSADTTDGVNAVNNNSQQWTLFTLDTLDTLLGTLDCMTSHF